MMYCFIQTKKLLFHEQKLFFTAGFLPLGLSDPT